MRVVRIQVDGKVKLLTQTSHESRELPRSCKLPLSLRSAHDNRHVQFTRRFEDMPLSRTRSAMLKCPMATHVSSRVLNYFNEFLHLVVSATNNLQAGCQEVSQSQINLDIARWFGTADQQVTWGWWLQWIGLIFDSPSDQRALAGMADPRAARPLYGNVASLCEFQQTGKS